MLLSDRSRMKKLAATAFGLIALGLAAGCQVRPLYSTGSATELSTASVSISEAEDRVEQRVRNELIFMFGGGRGEPVTAAYNMELQGQVARQSTFWSPPRTTWRVPAASS